MLCSTKFSRAVSSQPVSFYGEYNQMKLSGTPLNSVILLSPVMKEMKWKWILLWTFITISCDYQMMLMTMADHYRGKPFSVIQIQKLKFMEVQKKKRWRWYNRRYGVMQCDQGNEEYRINRRMKTEQWHVMNIFRFIYAQYVCQICCHDCQSYANYGRTK